MSGVQTYRTSDLEAGGLQAVIDAAREVNDPIEYDPTENKAYAFVVPHGAHLAKLLPDEALLGAPQQLRGAVTVEDVASFEAYIKHHYDKARTTAWVDLRQHRVIGVLNDATKDTSAWRDHRATLQLVKTPEWERWRRLDGKISDQEAFARHIELTEPDIKEPDAATLLEIAQTLHGSTNAEWRSAMRLSNGEVQFSYVEEASAAAGRNGDLQIPTEFGLLIAPFYGEEPVPVTALLRYRVRGGDIRIGYELVRPDDVERTCLEAIADQLRKSIDRVYTGSPAPAGR